MSEGRSSLQFQKKRSDKDSLFYLWTFIKPHTKIFSFVLTLLMVNVLLGVTAPLLFRKAMDLVNQLTPSAIIHIWKVLIAYFLIMLVRFFTMVFQNVCTVHLNSRVTNDLRIHLFSQLLKNKICFYDQAETGVLTSNITNDTQEMYDTGERFVYVFSMIIRLIATVGILWYFSWRLTLYSILFLPVFFIIAVLMRKYQRLAEKRWRINFGKVNQKFNESMRSIAISKSFQHEEENLYRFEEVNEATYRSSIKRGIAIFIIGPINDFFRHILLIVILAFGTLEYSAPHSTLSIASFYLFVFLLDYYFYPLMALARNYSRFQSLFANLERLMNIGENLSIQEINSGIESGHALQGKIEFQNVSFSYTHEKPVLKNLCFTIDPGQRMAIVGHTGAGKSTIASLIMKFYDITKGTIFLDGKNLEDYEVFSLRKSIGLVSQRVFVFEGTVRDNLLLGNPHATDHDIWNTLDAVQAREFIELLPRGLDSKISENGKNLSTGQRQTISFARTLLSNPRIIILDEATSSVDLYTESKIQDSIELLLQGRSSIVIAHRLTTILKSDFIVVLDKGEIIQMGPHEQLMEQSGAYQEMYHLYFETQSAKFLERFRRKPIG